LVKAKLCTTSKKRQQRKQQLYRMHARRIVKELSQDSSKDGSGAEKCFEQFEFMGCPFVSEWSKASRIGKRSIETHLGQKS
jgi:hypothetical protein